MLNIEIGRGNKPIRMDSNILLDAVTRVGAISPYQRPVRFDRLRTVRKRSDQSPKEHQVNTCGEIKEVSEKLPDTQATNHSLLQSNLD